MDGKIFVNWAAFDHPQLGKVEIGGFVRKIYDEKLGSYTNILCTPGEVFEDFLKKHTEWNLYLISKSPLVRITDVSVIPGEAGYFKVIASVQNQGFLPTNVTEQAIRNRTAKTVKVYIALEGATLEMGKAAVDVGFLSGTASSLNPPIHQVEWMIKATKKGEASAVIKVVSEKGGMDTKKITFR
jgi:hypothetical protein